MGERRIIGKGNFATSERFDFCTVLLMANNLCIYTVVALANLG